VKEQYCTAKSDNILLAGNGWTYHHRLGILVFMVTPLLPMRT
jgi:hypothetical protein